MFADYVSAFFFLVSILLFDIFHFLIIELFIVIFVLVVPWLFLPDSLLKVFSDMSEFFAVMTFCYVYTFFMTEAFPLVPVFPTSRTRTFIFGFYVEVISSSLGDLRPAYLFIRSNFTESLSFILSIVRGWYLSSCSSSRISTMIWYSSGKFYSIWFIISESSLCTSSFCRYPLVTSILLIHSLEFLATTYSLHFSNFLPSVVLKSPVVSSTCFEAFIYTSLVYHTYFLLSLGHQKHESGLFLIVRVSDHCKLWSWVT